MLRSCLRAALCVGWLTLLAALPTQAAAQELNPAAFQRFLAGLKAAGFKYSVSEETPELTKPAQQQYEKIPSLAEYNWIEGLEGGKPVRYTIESPSGKTKAVLYARRDGVDYVNPQEIAQVARRMNFGVNDYLGSSWRQLYPQVDRYGQNRDQMVWLGNVAGLLYRPEPDKLAVPALTERAKKLPPPSWRSQIPKPTLRNRVSGSDWSWDEAVDNGGSFINNNNNEVVTYPGGRNPYIDREDADSSDMELDDADAVEFFAHDDEKPPEKRPGEERPPGDGEHSDGN
ncbi:MAG: hypothetical protein U1E59_12115 [Amaricoccus sp.]